MGNYGDKSLLALTAITFRNNKLQGVQKCTTFVLFVVL